MADKIFIKMNREVLYNEMIRLQKIIRYYAGLKGKTKKALKAKLNNPKIKISDIYDEIFIIDNNNNN